MNYDNHTISSPSLPFSPVELNQFLKTATQNTYANTAVQAQDADEAGFKVLRFTEGDWKYEDKYCGNFRDWGGETIWYKRKVVWNSKYGGGMVEEYIGNNEMAEKTFSFLKSAMREKDNSPENFQLRGPQKFTDGNWEYVSNTNGNITAFNATEEITYEGKVIFFHYFIGGLVIS